MSDRLTPSYSDCDGRPEKPMHSVQSVWMARWTRTSYNATAETHSYALNALGNKENDRDPKPLRSIVELETMSKLSNSVKRLRKSETQTFEVVKESLRTSSRTIAKEILGLCSVPLHSPCENVKAHSYVSGRSIVAARPFLDNPSGLASHIVPYQNAGYDITQDGEKTRKLLISRSALAAKDEVPRLRMLEAEHYNYHNHSASLDCDEKLNNCPEPGKPITPYSRQYDTFLPDVPSTSTKNLPEFREEEFKKVPGRSFRLFQNKSSASRVSESKELHHCSYDQRKLLLPLHDVERTRKGDTREPVLGQAGYSPPISRTTHSLIMAKRTDANLCEGNKAIGKRKWSEFNGKATLSDHDIPSKSFGHHKGGIKLQLLDCSTGSEGKLNIEETKLSKVVFKNESSADTDTMDLDVFQEKSQLCGISSSIVKKVNKMDQNPPPERAVDCSKKEARCKWFDLNINLELPAPTDTVEPTSSRTESLDLEAILAHAERPRSSRTNICPEELHGQDPSSRWLKRLKAGASGSLVFGTKCSSFRGESSHERVDKFLSKVTIATITSSQPTSSKLLGKELTSHDNTPSLAMNSSPSSSTVIKKDQELLTSHSWIRRLLRDRATTAEKRSQPVMLCEPQSSKLELDDLHKKQLPSLGAMALMGKAMNGFQPCEFHRRGPLVVWNTKSF